MTRELGARVRSVEVVIRWGSAVLRVVHLCPPRRFTLGTSAEIAGEAVDFVVPPEALRAALRLVDVDAAGRVRVAVPARARGVVARGGAEQALEERATPDGAEPLRSIDLAPGTEVRLELGALTAVVRGDDEAVPRIPAWHRHGASPLLYGASALVHVALLGALAAFYPAQPASFDDAVSTEQIDLMQRALMVSAERELEEKESAASADAKEGGTGTRAHGEEGGMGAPSLAQTGQRFGVAGPADDPDPHIARAAALRDGAEFGMIGLLASGSGGDPNAPTAPWGRDDSLGAGPGFGVGHGGGAGSGLGGLGGLGHGGARSSSNTAAPSHAASSAPPALQPPQLGAFPTPPSPPRALAPIDPNGRFATTYRPGGGHLAAFEAAVARGVVPAADREVIGDVGARYAPAIDPDPGKTLTVRADLERAAIAPAGGPFHLRLGLRSTPEAAERPHLSVHLVLDVSGSMAGAPMVRAREAAWALVNRLAPGDDFSLTTFSTDASVLVPDGPVGARRERIWDAIAGIRESGGTNIGAGLERAYREAATASIPADAVRVVLLLSDGRANEGVTGRESLSRLALGAFQSGVQTSSFGLGADYDGALMSALADDGAGGYYYLRDPEQIGPALATELDRRLDPVASAVEVRVRLKPDVKLLRVYGSRRLGEVEAAKVRAIEVAADQQAEKRSGIAQNRQEDAAGGMRFLIPAFARDDAHSILLELDAPPGAGSRGLATVEVKYKDRVRRKNVVEELPVDVAYADGDAASAATAAASVLRTVQGFAAGQALTDAAALVAAGDPGGAAALLEEREGILRQAATKLNEPLFASDADRLARLRGRSGAAGGSGDPLVLAMLLDTAGKARLR